MTPHEQRVIDWAWEHDLFVSLMRDRDPSMTKAELCEDMKENEAHFWGALEGDLQRHASAATGQPPAA